MFSTSRSSILLRNLFAPVSIALVGFVAPLLAFAQSAPQSFHYQGEIISNSTGLPLTSRNVTFTLQVVSPGAEACVLYEETQTLDMSSSNGVFDLAVGAGTPTSGAGSKNPVPLLNHLSLAFSNASAYSNLHCSQGNSYTPSPGDQRKLNVSFNDGTNTVTIPQPYLLSSVPYALVADSLQGYAPSQFLQVNSTTPAVNQVNMEAVFSSTASVNALLALINGTSNLYMSSSNATGANLPSYTTASPPSSPIEGDIWYNSTLHSIQYQSNAGTQTISLGGGGGGGVTSITAGTGLSGGTITTTGTISLPNTGAIGTYTKVTTDAQGRITTGTTLSASDIPNLTTAGQVSGSTITSGTIGGSTIINTNGSITATSMSSNSVGTRSLQLFDGQSTPNTITLQAPATVGTSYTWTLPATHGNNGDYLMTNGSGVLSWNTPAGGGSGTVTSVSLAMPTLFTVSGSPVTTSGTLTASLANQSGNTVLASPADGSSGAPAFRTIAQADLPAQPYVVGGTFLGIFNNSQVLLQHPFPINVTIPSGCTNSRFEFATAATASTTISLQKCTGVGFTSCSTFGTAVIGAGNKSASFTCSSSTSFIGGTDSLLITGPATADTTASNAGWALYGTR